MVTLTARGVRCPDQKASLMQFIVRVSFKESGVAHCFLVLAQIRTKVGQFWACCAANLVHFCIFFAAICVAILSGQSCSACFITGGNKV